MQENNYLELFSHFFVLFFFLLFVSFPAIELYLDKRSKKKERLEQLKKDLGIE
ncbi:hypothetical protein [Campylobacter helveticus]|uniref:hypothetical protein n=1 Tax=Campylobacter helveticus TaxID=28898 RepID=UPI0009C1A903|nr:hypothetical protein [Campylobacter helveticus]ELU1350196.1 hypothetical protein [Campylobacter jejuni]ARE81410.1 hypothetical protein CHELV3228_a0035 [Campylobacter helveticus]MCR2039830.1 hypothetical protein [Campylobacter helveticus]MCR2054836.1 hypothetical protein [Campylobacter helveticus]MCR2060329.1 hypothetical protein [Campylobacter helveticus]